MGLIGVLSIYYFIHCNSKLNNLCLFLIYFCSMIVTFSMESNLSTNTLVFYAYSILFVFLIFVLGLKFKVNKEQYIYFLDAVIIVSLISASYALVFCPEQIAAALGASNAYGNELSSFFVSSHEYGLYMGASIIGCFFGLQSFPSKRKKTFYIIALIVLVPNLLMTFSRTSIYSTAIFFLFYVFSLKKKRLKILILLASFVFIFLCFTWSPLNSLLENLFAKGSAGRDSLYAYALEYYADYSPIEMLFGSGIERVRADFETALDHGSVHCAYLQILLYFGAIGLIWLLFCLVAALILYCKLKKMNRQWAWNFICLLIWCACIMLTNTTVIFTSPVDSYFLTVFAWIIPRYVCNAIRLNDFQKE